MQAGCGGRWADMLIRSSSRTWRLGNSKRGGATQTCAPVGPVPRWAREGAARAVD